MGKNKKTLPISSLIQRKEEYFQLQKVTGGLFELQRPMRASLNEKPSRGKPECSSGLYFYLFLKRFLVPIQISGR
ncbi:hypothetical protein LEP1GSC125_0783 [Leptospira mayottensis 200901122]|uniref:Uncharacterized protein n=2 Tax=Leptospira mayottensis TaxID=1137606 RepID=A0AA87MTP1_9LEPT|nr:hypothetical protein DQM28_08440 [Leptospira mayottensis]EKS02310.1 hypothetical protein LEP1GSC125_0783 [Leptospira mayottensis 200901122]